MTPSPHLNYHLNAGANHMHKPTFDGDDTPYKPTNAIADQRMNVDSLAFLNEMSDQLQASAKPANANADNSYHRDVNSHANDLPPNFPTNRNEVCPNSPKLTKTKLIDETNERLLFFPILPTVKATNGTNGID